MRIIIWNGFHAYACGINCLIHEFNPAFIRTHNEKCFCWVCDRIKVDVMVAPDATVIYAVVDGTHIT